MDGPTILRAMELFVVLLAIAALVAIASRPLRIPYTVALVLVGLVVGIAGSAIAPTATFRVTPELVLVALVPGLVFDAAYRLRLAELRRLVWPVALLALPGVLISAAIVAVVLHVATGLRFELAFVVGAMVSATDPAAVIATFKRLAVPPRLATLVDGESLLNDATGLVVFAIALRAVAGPVDAVDAAATFAGAIVISGAIGLAAGFAASRLMALTDDHLVELTISLVLAYGTYLAADAFHQSGIIATVAAAVVLGNRAPGTSLTPTGEDALDTVWEFLAYLLTALVFLLVGLAIRPADLGAALGSIAWAVVGVLVARAVVVYGLLGLSAHLLPRLTTAMPRAWLHVLFWAGLRGAVAVAMALAIPVDVPQRELLQQVTFGVVLFTLIVQGTTSAWVVVRSGSAVVGSPEAAISREAA